MDMLKAKINSNLAHKPKKGLPMDELQLRQNEFLLQLQDIYALQCSFAILFFYYVVLFCSVLSKFYLNEETKPKPYHRRDRSYQTPTPRN